MQSENRVENSSNKPTNARNILSLFIRRNNFYSPQRSSLVDNGISLLFFFDGICDAVVAGFDQAT